MVDRPAGRRALSDHLDRTHLSRLIDGDLSLVSRDAARAHLASCPQCAQRHDELVGVVASLRQLPRAEWTPHQTERLTTAMSQRRRSRLPLAGAGAAVLIVFVAVLVAALPLIGAAFALGHVAQTLVSSVAAEPLVAIVPQLVVLVAVAVLAPLAAYPLARWR